MEDIIVIFLLVSFLLAFLAAAILIWVNKDQQHSNRFLGMLLIILALTNLNDVFLYKAWFLQFPYLHKFVLPITLLIFPLAWLYIRSVLLGELKSRRKDWLILIPTIACIIDLLPYYTMPIADKVAYLKEFFAHPYLQARFSEGILSPYVFTFVRVIWCAVFITLNFRLISQFRHGSSKTRSTQNEALIQWLALFNWLLTILLASSFINAIISPLFKTNMFFVDLMSGITVIIICLKLFTKPSLLYGVYQPIASYDTITEVPLSIPNQEDQKQEKPLTAEKLETGFVVEKLDPQIFMSQADSIRYKKIIEAFFEKESPFLQKDYTLEKLVIDTNLPRHVISGFVNREYGMGFREFLNRYRVNYFIDNRDNPDWKNLTLEAIAAECGYSTRSTFIANFKQITGQTPSEYIKQASK